MAEEVDLVGLDKQLKDIQIHINELSDGLGTMQSRLKGLMSIDVANNTKAFDSALKSLAVSASEIKSKLSSGDSAVRDFIKLFQQLGGLKSVPVLPITGLIETLNNLTGSCKAAANEYKNLLNPQVKSTEEERLQQRMNILNGLVNATKMQGEREKRAAENSAFYTRQKNKELEKEAMLRERAAKRQEEINKLIYGINIKGAAAPFKNEALYIRMSAMLDAIKTKQSQCNTETEKGRKEYQEYANQIAKVKSEMGQLGVGTNKLSKAMGKMKGFAEQMALSFGVMTGVFGVTNFFKSLYKITAEFQLQTKALAAIINNAREANILFNQMKSLAIESPMKLMDLNKYAKQLAAFRIETNELYGSLKMLGDISVGVGVDMDRLILAYGQVKAANYLRGQELRQVSEAGVNILGGLKEYYRETKNLNLSINDIFDSISKRKVLFEDVDAVLKKMTASGGEFYNMQLIQSQTLYGQIQKLGDMFQIEMNNVGKSVSGTMLSLIKLVQFVIKNLRSVVTILMTLGAAKFMTKLIFTFSTLNAESTKLRISVLRTAASFRRLGASKFSSMAAGIASSAKAMGLLGGAITGAALATGLLIAKISDARAKQKQFEEDMVNEFGEYVKRLHEVSEIEGRFDASNTYKDRLIALQDLADKAKEYMYTLQLPEKVTAENINEAFANASKELDDYIQKVYEYKSALKTPDVDKELDDWSRVNTEFATASMNAKQLFLDYEKNYENLPEAQRKAFDAIKEEEEAFLSNEEKAREKYGITIEQWRRDFVIAINNLDQYYKVMASKGTQYGGYAGLGSDEGYFSFPFGDENAQKYAQTRMHNINKFVDLYVETFDKTKEIIEQRLKYSGIDLSEWKLLDEAGLKSDLEKRIKDMVPAIMDAFKDAPEYFRQNLPDLLGDIAELKDKNIVATIMWKVVHAKSNVADSEFEKFIEEALTFDDIGNTEEGLTKNVTVKIKTQLDDGKGGYKEVEQTINTAMRGAGMLSEQTQTTIKTIEDMVMSVANASKNATGGVKERKKAAEDEYKQWVSIKKQIDLAKNSTLQQAVLIKSINKQLGTSFSTLKDIAIVADLALQNGKIWFDINSWELPKDKTHTRMQSMKEEYKSMIDFVRELNTEFDKLRKDFNKDDTEMWRGATNRILTSFEDKFLAMPKKFREAFKNGLKDIDFTTNEGTLAAEEIVKGLIKNAKNITKKEKDELLRAWGEAVGQIKLDIDLNERSLEKERLKYRVQKMFDDYNLTIELDKLGVNTDEIADLFNITTRDLGSLQSKLESMREEFMGTDDEKRYREHMRKIVELNEKANLEMAKKYVKYLRQEYDERAKLEIEYMKKRADVYSLPFESDVQSRILDNLKKEFDEKMSKLNWDTFRGSDAYIDMFEDLGRVSTKALTDMRDKIYELKGSLTGLKPSDMKTMVEAIRKLDDEVIKRNPFKAIVESMREIKNMKIDSDLRDKMSEYLGGKLSLNFSKNIESALIEARNRLANKQNDVVKLQVDIDAKNTIKNAQAWLNDNLASLQNKLELPVAPYVENLDVLKKMLKNIGEEIDTERLKGLTSDEGLTEAEQKWLALYNIIKRLSDIKASKETLGERLGIDTKEDENNLENLDKEIKVIIEDIKKMSDAETELTKKEKGIKQFAEDSAKSLEELKGVFSSLMENLDYFGGTTDDLTDAWKEFGESIFDTIIGALNMIPSLISGFTAAGVAINSAMGIVGLIAEIIQLVITLLTSLYKLHDAKIWHDLDKYTLQINRLKKAYEDLSAVFDDMYSTDDLVSYTSMTIENLKKTKWEYEQYQTAYSKLKKQNAEDLENVKTEIENLEKEIRERSEKLKEELGGFGSMANMKSMAQEWSDAWYDAFKETGDGLSGLEDSFDEFLDNLYKRQILNALGKKYFEGLFKDLDNLLLKEGGLAENRYEFSEWASRVRDAMGAFSEEAKGMTDILSSAGGLGSNLEGLQASLQGMTESTAEALEAYLNSIRFYVAGNSERLEAIANSLLSTTATNPMLEQLRMIAANTSAMQTLLDSVVQPSGYQGANGSGRPYIRVHAHMD